MRRRGLALAAAGLALVLAPAAASAAAQAGSCSDPRLLILTIHGGGFVLGHPSDMARQVAIARAVAPQARVHSARYPLGSPNAAYRAVRRVAQRHCGPVVAYGFSAGGYVAARLAAAGDVAAAVSVAGLYDLARYAEHSGAGVMERAILGVLTDQDARSVVLRPGPRAAPLRMLHGDRDDTAPLAHARRYDRMGRRTDLQVLRGAGHEQPARAVRRAMRWLVAAARI